MKCHVPGIVRFVVEEEATEEEKKESETKPLPLKRRKHFEYSKECFDIIGEYNQRYPEALAAIAKDI